ncbi:putative Condensin complex subunit 3 [Monocercomonoides exilis]|uniref:putative Condensin complex subunit 3 n=1 Tax=Monocercomonoides exilis TaxID=2049356 RepID=UPI00355A3D4C|nr:putative Condensin complex subunit 3 [Monocercomonoides exilis]|eukprot:MONOS_580.1-p1 / transcript=MONOS_580.1 / gene=MONOS_580 / organism=Monocercomonoides_exilis_PA203 / gene_product=Condensin complex subunit 3 / transcript_product=Condensin complex subunit 3 / location=Mono_scaffold00009:161148-167582(+) / protein_length=2144 / sequence_SO=supercontig / SO=protein_coding / is_pseudo=false
MTSIVSIFESHTSTAQTKNSLSNLNKLFQNAFLKKDSSFHTNFIECINHVLAVGPNDAHADALIKLVAAFCSTSKVQIAPQQISSPKRHGEAQALLAQYQIDFAESFLHYLVKCASVNDRNVRLRSLQLIGELLQKLNEDSEFSAAILDEVQEVCIIRSVDRIPTIRAMAGFAMHRLQSPTLGIDCPVVKAYVRMLSDSVPEVRLAALKYISPHIGTIPFILDRLSDTSPLIRLETISVIHSKIPIDALLPSQITFILSRCFGHRDKALGDACADLICNAWLRQKGNNPVQLLDTFALSIVDGRGRREVERERRLAAVKEAERQRMRGTMLMRLEEREEDDADNAKWAVESDVEEGNDEEEPNDDPLAVLENERGEKEELKMRGEQLKLMRQKEEDEEKSLKHLSSKAQGRKMTSELRDSEEAELENEEEGNSTMSASGSSSASSLSDLSSTQWQAIEEAIQQPPSISPLCSLPSMPSLSSINHAHMLIQSVAFILAGYSITHTDSVVIDLNRHSLTFGSVLFWRYLIVTLLNSPSILTSSQSSSGNRHNLRRLTSAKNTPAQLSRSVTEDLGTIPGESSVRSELLDQLLIPLSPFCGLVAEMVQLMETEQREKNRSGTIIDSAGGGTGVSSALVTPPAQWLLTEIRARWALRRKMHREQQLQILRDEMISQMTAAGEVITPATQLPPIDESLIEPDAITPDNTLIPFMSPKTVSYFLRPLMIGHALLIIPLLDFDEAGRRTALSLFRSLLSSNTLPFCLIDPVVKGLSRAVDTIDELMTVFFDCSLKIVPQTHMLKDVIQTDNEDDSQNVGFNAVGSSVSEERPEPRQTLLPSSARTVADITFHPLLRILRITSSFIVLHRRHFPPPSLPHLLSQVVFPSIAHPFSPVRASAMQVLGQICLLSKGHAKERLPLLIHAATSDVPRVQLQAMRGLFDLMLLYGVETVAAEMKRFCDKKREKQTSGDLDDEDSILQSSNSSGKDLGLQKLISNHSISGSPLNEDEKEATKEKNKKTGDSESDDESDEQDLSDWIPLPSTISAHLCVITPSSYQSIPLLVRNLSLSLIPTQKMTMHPFVSAASAFFGSSTGANTSPLSSLSLYDTIMSQANSLQSSSSGSTSSSSHLSSNAGSLTDRLKQHEMIQQKERFLQRKGKLGQRGMQKLVEGRQIVECAVEGLVKLLATGRIGFVFEKVESDENEEEEEKTEEKDNNGDDEKNEDNREGDADEEKDDTLSQQSHDHSDGFHGLSSQWPTYDGHIPSTQMLITRSLGSAFELKTPSLERNVSSSITTPYESKVMEESPMAVHNNELSLPPPLSPHSASIALLSSSKLCAATGYAALLSQLLVCLFHPSTTEMDKVRQILFVGMSIVIKRLVVLTEKDRAKKMKFRREAKNLSESNQSDFLESMEVGIQDSTCTYNGIRQYIEQSLNRESGSTASTASNTASASRSSSQASSFNQPTVISKANLKHLSKVHVQPCWMQDPVEVIILSFSLLLRSIAMSSEHSELREADFSKITLFLLQITDDGERSIEKDSEKEGVEKEKEHNEDEQDKMEMDEDNEKEKEKENDNEEPQNDKTEESTNKTTNSSVTAKVKAKAKAKAKSKAKAKANSKSKAQSKKNGKSSNKKNEEEDIESDSEFEELKIKMDEDDQPLQDKTDTTQKLTVSQPNSHERMLYRALLDAVSANRSVAYLKRDPDDESDEDDEYSDDEEDEDNFGKRGAKASSRKKNQSASKRGGKQNRDLRGRKKSSPLIQIMKLFIPTLKFYQTPNLIKFSKMLKQKKSNNYRESDLITSECIFFTELLLLMRKISNQLEGDFQLQRTWRNWLNSIGLEYIGDSTKITEEMKEEQGCTPACQLKYFLATGKAIRGGNNAKEDKKTDSETEKAEGQEEDKEEESDLTIFELERMCLEERITFHTSQMHEWWMEAYYEVWNYSNKHKNRQFDDEAQVKDEFSDDYEANKSDEGSKQKRKRKPNIKKGESEVAKNIRQKKQEERSELAMEESDEGGEDELPAKTKRVKDKNDQRRGNGNSAKSQKNNKKGNKGQKRRRRRYEDSESEDESEFEASSDSDEDDSSIDEEDLNDSIDEHDAGESSSDEEELSHEEEDDRKEEAEGDKEDEEDITKSILNSIGEEINRLSMEKKRNSR